MSKFAIRILLSEYLDDILLLSDNNEKHLEYLRTTCDKLQATGLKLKRTKCDFLTWELHYLGNFISEKGIYPLSEMLQSIKNLPVPRINKEVRQMLGFTE